MTWLLLVGLNLACLLVLPASAQQSSEVEDQLDLPADSWPWWRGPNRMGEVADTGNYPQHWSIDQAIKWSAPIDGRGHSSPIVIAGLVVITTADESTGGQFVIAYDQQTGEQVWTTCVHEEGAMSKNAKASAASSTAATDGERLFVCFPNTDAIHATALSLAGEIIWQRPIGEYVVHQGYGSSPALYRDLVILTSDNKSGGAIVALRRENGEVVWSVDRPEMPNYPSPTLLRINGRDQLLMTGCELVTSLDPLSGNKLWELAGATTECVTSTVTDGTHIYSSGGYPRNHVAAIVADGSAAIAWETNDRVYVPSMLIRDGCLFAVMDAGIAVCWDSASGKEKWRGRVGGNFTASPVLVGEKIYATNEEGTTTIFAASPDAFEILATNQLGDEVLATPTFCGDSIFMRVVHRQGDERQEILYCIGD